MHIIKNIKNIKKILSYTAITAASLHLISCSTNTPAPVSTRDGYNQNYNAGFQTTNPNMPNYGNNQTYQPLPQTPQLPPQTIGRDYNQINNQMPTNYPNGVTYQYGQNALQNPNVNPNFNANFNPPPAVMPVGTNALNPSNNFGSSSNLQQNQNALNNLNNPSKPFTPVQIANINEPVPAGYYRAMPGDTLYKIARTYNIAPKDLLTWNNLADPNQLNLYQLVRITPIYASNANPNPAAILQNPANANPAPVTPKAITPTPAAQPQAKRTELLWPIKNGRVIRKFDQKSIDIAGRDGDVVLASGDGKVLFANTMTGYGKLVMISHNPEIVTVYAQLSHIAVRDQQQIKKGQTIGLIGGGGNEQAKLQFQVRQNSKAIDPVPFLTQN